MTSEEYDGLSVADVGRMYQSLGCPHGCRDGIKGAQGDDVRTQSRSFLQRLLNVDKMQFSRYIRCSFLAQPLQSVMDQLHALIGFCAEPFVVQPGCLLLSTTLFVTCSRPDSYNLSSCFRTLFNRL